MPSKSKRRNRISNPDRAATTDVVTQLECAIRYPQATLIGALVGGIVPWFARTLAHVEVPSAWSTGNYGLVALLLAVVLGCACFSALTVYKFGKATFGCSRKALGFVLAIEGVMLVSQGAASTVALAVLIAINALANGSAIALSREATCKHREAVKRAAATRARKNSSTRAKEPIEVVNAQVPTNRRPHPARVPVMPAWMVNVQDAEIVSEQKLLA